MVSVNSDGIGKSAQQSTTEWRLGYGGADAAVDGVVHPMFDHGRYTIQSFTLTT